MAHIHKTPYKHGGGPRLRQTGEEVATLASPTQPVCPADPTFMAVLSVEAVTVSMSVHPEASECAA